MAADDIDEIDELDDDAGAVDDVDEEELDEEDLSDDLHVDEDDDAVIGTVDDEIDDEDENAEAASKAAKPSTDDDEEDEEDLGPDDVEADLDTILKGKIASEDDLDDDDEDEDEALVVPVKKTVAEQADGVTARQEGEFSCPGCFMVVHPRQFGRRSNPVCPSGEEDCPGIEIAFGTS